ncbi:MAG: hypothetical protein ABI611_09105 [Solirubrobacteraceae bacterium]
MASTAAASHSWNGYHWARQSNPFNVKLGDDVSSSWDAYLRSASTDWSADTGGNPLNTTVTTGLTNGKQCRATVGRVEVCSAAYGKRGWLGLASISVNGGHITQGTAKMNDTYYSTPTYNTPFWRGAVMCQEVGHTFGLDHQDESGADLHTCMDYANKPDTDNTRPNQHDYDELALIYSHFDGTTTIGLSAKNGAKPYRTDRTDKRRTSKIVEHFADGSKRITFIYWAIR